MLPMTEGALVQLGHLFDVELRYQDGLPPVCDVHDNWQLVGSGTGHVEGPRVRGAVRWSNFEQTFEDHCRLNVMGTIQTADGAEIRFDSQGFAVSPKQGTWKVASAVRFTTTDTRYRWLEAGPAVWEGEFDAAIATARYRAYLPDAPRLDGV
jgi:hypothetical protein